MKPCQIQTLGTSSASARHRKCSNCLAVPAGQKQHDQGRLYFCRVGRGARYSEPWRPIFNLIKKIVIVLFFYNIQTRSYEHIWFYERDPSRQLKKKQWLLPEASGSNRGEGVSRDLFCPSGPGGPTGTLQIELGSELCPCPCQWQQPTRWWWRVGWSKLWRCWTLADTGSTSSAELSWITRFIRSGVDGAQEAEGIFHVVKQGNAHTSVAWRTDPWRLAEED